MGTASPALVIAAVLVAAVAPAHAEPCTGVTGSGGRFATCFDLGNRLSVTAGSDGFGGSLALRHVMRFDDEPDLVWKLEHVLGEATHGGWQEQFAGVVYRGRFVRHARDGHLVLPLGTPKKVFLPFDIGALTEVGSLHWQPGELVRVGVVKIAGLVDFARTRGFKRRLAIGPVARWEMELARDPVAVAEHVVAPFSMLMANLRFESRSGLYVGDLTAEAGTVWRGETGWSNEATAAASLERIVLAVNDRPIALVVGASYETATGEAIARIGARVVLFHRTDQRVNLRPLAASR